MPSGSKRRRGNDEYVFIDGKAMRSDEAVVVEVGDVIISSQQSADVSAPGQEEAAHSKKQAGAAGKRGGMGDALRHLREDDAFELNPEFLEGGIPFAKAEALFIEEKRKNRRKYLAVGLLLAVAVFLSLCISTGMYWHFYSPAEVVSAWGAWVQVQIHDIAAGVDFDSDYMAGILESNPDYWDITATGPDVLKYLLCGVFLALAGALFQNAFRNPIAAPSMLGVTNGVNVAVLVLVLAFGTEAAALSGYYYLFTFAGGILVLILVLFGGKWISGKGNFNVMNMLLMGTVVSQLLGTAVRFVQTNIFTTEQWDAYYQLTYSVDIDTVYTYISLAVCAVVAVVPIVLFRMRLNLVSFSDQETRLLGVDPNKLRVLALTCGSVLVLCAQVNAGQVAMVSLVVPFAVRAFFGSEFRKQLWGNVLFGALLMVVCWDVTSFVQIGNFDLPIGTVVSVIALPLFVWMITMRQRSWD